LLLLHLLLQRLSLTLPIHMLLLLVLLLLLHPLSSRWYHERLLRPRLLRRCQRRLAAARADSRPAPLGWTPRLLPLRLLLRAATARSRGRACSGPF
jgi:hypothetical protein